MSKLDIIVISLIASLAKKKTLSFVLANAKVPIFDSKRTIFKKFQKMYKANNTNKK